MAKILEKIFGTASQRQIKKLMPMLDEFGEIAERMSELSDNELRGMTDKFRGRIAAETIDFHKELIELDAEIAECDDADAAPPALAPTRDPPRHDAPQSISGVR